MKRCPKCNGTYTDEHLNYCLADGTALSIEFEQITKDQTIVMQREPVRKGKPLLWLGLTGLVLLIVGGAIVGLLIFEFGAPGGSVRAERRSAVTLPTSPIPQTTPRVIIPPPASAENSPVEESSPKTEGSKPAPDNDDADDITPIGWDTAAAGFKGEGGKTFTFRCPKGGTAEAIWGSDVYTDYSSICTAAVHAGLIKLTEGGKVTIEYRPGRSIYGSTVRNGITSNTAGDCARSFVVR